MAPTPQDGSLPLLDLHERARYRAAAEYALRRYPGPVGELIHRELPEAAVIVISDDTSDEALLQALESGVCGTPVLEHHIGEAMTGEPRPVSARVPGPLPGALRHSARHEMKMPCSRLSSSTPLA